MPAYLLKRISIFLLVTLALLSQSMNCQAYEIIVLQTSPASYYEEAFQGFLSTATESVFKGGGKSAQPDTVSRLYLSEKNSRENLQRQIEARQPDMILAIGGNALQQALQQKEIPVVYLLAPNSSNISREHANITGVNMVIPPVKQLSLFSETLPSVKSLGLIYDPRKNRAFVEEAISIAAINGISLVAVEATAAQQVPGLLAGLNGMIDAFWMIPDSTVTTANTIESMLLFSFENQIPLLTFADKYLELGATVSATFDIYDMGAQAGKLGRRIMSSPQTASIAAESPDKVNYRLNNKIAAKMGLLLNTAGLDQRDRE